jgi:hypothetical protein
LRAASVLEGGEVFADALGDALGDAPGGGVDVFSTGDIVMILERAVDRFVAG